MFSSSGRDTSSWVHTWGHGKRQEVSPQNALCHVPAPLAPAGWQRRWVRKLMPDEY